MPGRSFNMVVKKVLVDQIIASPVSNHHEKLQNYFWLCFILDCDFHVFRHARRNEKRIAEWDYGRNKAQVLASVPSRVDRWISKKTLICHHNVSILVWPTAQFINFWILPNRFRVLYDNTISLGYDVYTSAVINEPLPAPSHVPHEKPQIELKTIQSQMIQS